MEVPVTRPRTEPGSFDDDTAREFIRIAQNNRPGPGVDDRFVLDNRVEGEPLGPHAFENRLALPAFYGLKFGYYLDKLELLLPEGAPGRSDAQYDPRLHEAYEIWDRLFGDECRAYLLRMSQSPRPVVVEAWYNDVPEFKAWAERLEQIEVAQLESALSLAFPVDLVAERDNNRRFSELYHDLKSHLGVPMSVSSAVAGFRTNFADQVIARLSEVIHASLVDPEADFDSTIRSLVRVVASEYGIRICDYLQVTTINTSTRLEVLVSSSAARIEQVRESEQMYEPAEGITGTVLLLSREDVFRWVGTGNLGLDPRAGPKHKKEWLDLHVYGPVDSFWVFPLFNGDRIEGALRVIDVEPDGHIARLNASSPWSYAVRAELAHIADWLGTVLDLVRTALPGGQPDSVVRLVARSRRLRGGILSWVPLRYVGALLDSLSRLALMRSEHRTVGCMVAVGTAEGIYEFTKGTRPYASVPDRQRSGMLDNAGELFGRVLPGAGVFVCEIPPHEAAETPTVEYVDVITTEFLEPEAGVERYGATPGLCFLVVDGDRDMLRIYEEGSAVADYFLNEKTGRWHLRDFVEIENQLGALVQHVVSRFQLQAALRQAIEFSYDGSGGLIVLAKGGVQRDVVSREGFPVEQLLDSMDPRVFASVAAVDGGTWIDAESGRVKQAGILFTSAYDDDDEVQTGGARHKAAKHLWKELPDALILAVSTNRSITAYISASLDGETTGHQLLI